LRAARHRKEPRQSQPILARQAKPRCGGERFSEFRARMHAHELLLVGLKGFGVRVLADLVPDVVLEPAPGQGRVWWHQAGLPVQSLEARERIGPSGEGTDGDAARASLTRSGAPPRRLEQTMRNGGRWRLLPRMKWPSGRNRAGVSHRPRSWRRSRAPHKLHQRVRPAGASHPTVASITMMKTPVASQPSFCSIVPPAAVSAPFNRIRKY